jgi:hypothetical protein
MIVAEAAEVGATSGLRSSQNKFIILLNFGLST